MPIRRTRTQAGLLCLGRYEFPAPPLGSRVAVKIIDMLGEEIVVVSRI